MLKQYERGSHLTRARHPIHFVDAAFVFLIVLGIRIALIGHAPHMDEGHYVAAAYFQFQGYASGLFTENSVIPPYGGLEFYSLLLSWLFFIPAEPFFLFRFVDAICASLAGVMVFCYLHQATEHRWAALTATVITILALNHPLFIDAGGKNPIAAATLFLFSAAYLLERHGGTRVIGPGIAMALAVLLREAFAIFAVVWFMHSWYRYGASVTTRLAFVLAVTLAFGIGLVAALKGGVSGLEAIVHAYRNTPGIDPDFNQSFAERLRRAGTLAVRVAFNVAFCLPALALGLLSPLLARGRTPENFGSAYSFGIGLILAATVEVLLKRPWQYHISQMLLGGSILIALGLAALLRRSAARREPALSMHASIGIFLLVGHAALLMDFARTVRYAVGWSLHFAPVMISGNWNSPVVGEAYYLKMASLVRAHTAPEDRILSTWAGIYPLTGRLPVTRDTASLRDYLLLNRTNEFDARVLSHVRHTPPRLFIKEIAATLPKVIQRRLDSAASQFDTLFDSMHRLGPDLSPYRAETAIVRWRSTAKP